MTDFLIFRAVFFGLIAGDYVLQPQWMAEGKSKFGVRGTLICFLHSLIYTIATLLFLGPAGINPTVICIIFLSHYFIDRYSLGSVWLGWIRGRSIKAEEKQLQHAVTQSKPLQSWKQPFACIVYKEVDNGFHMILLYYALSLYFGVPFYG